jgi:hypothetical protein
MQIAIDTVDCTFVVHLNRRKSSTLVGDASVNRTYSALTLNQLRLLYCNTTGYAIECLDYNATLQACKHLATLLLTSIDERG